MMMMMELLLGLRFAILGGVERLYGGVDSWGRRPFLDGAAFIRIVMFGHCRWSQNGNRVETERK